MPRSRQICRKAIHRIHQAPEHDRLFARVDPDDASVRDLASSISAVGLLEPLAVTQDGFLAAGYRRLAAAAIAGLTSIPCLILPYKRAADPRRFLRELRERKRPHEFVDNELFNEVYSA